MLLMPHSGRHEGLQCGKIVLPEERQPKSILSVFQIDQLEHARNHGGRDDRLPEGVPLAGRFAAALAIESLHAVGA